MDLITVMYTYTRYPEAPLNLSKEKLEVFLDVAERVVAFAEQELEKEP